MIILLSVFYLVSCNNDKVGKNNGDTVNTKKTNSSSLNGGHYQGAFTNGMKKTYISFDVSDDGKELANLTFKGYWRCNGTLEQTTIGPEKNYTITNGKVDGVIIEPEGGAAPFRYELHGSITGDNAEGSLRVSNVPAGCDTYKLTWTAEKK